jgi:hypothetical protein
MLQNPMHPGYSYIIEPSDPVAHQLKNNRRLLGNRDIRCAGANH